MRLSKWDLILPLLAVTLIGGYIWFFAVETAEAQCGSQASSCKNCHEVQGELPVNADGTGWHQSHAFGDFCANCHAGNVQATAKDEAHVGMVPPLSDVKANCAACHPNDLTDRAQVYATVLGVTAGMGGGDSGTSASAPTAELSTTSAGSEIVVSSNAEVIDYNQRYEQAQGLNINWGDVTLMALIVVVAAGGGGYVYWNEKRLKGKTQTPNPKLQTSKTIELSEYPAEVLALVPSVARLNPVGLRALKRVLDEHDPDETSELLHSLSRLDPELVRRMRALDRDARALLLGLAGD